MAVRAAPIEPDRHVGIPPLHRFPVFQTPGHAARSIRADTATGPDPGESIPLAARGAHGTRARERTSALPRDLGVSLFHCNDLRIRTARTRGDAHPFDLDVPRGVGIAVVLGPKVGLVEPSPVRCSYHLTDDWFPVPGAWRPESPGSPSPHKADRTDSTRHADPLSMNDLGLTTVILTVGAGLGAIAGAMAAELMGALGKALPLTPRDNSIRVYLFVTEEGTPAVMAQGESFPQPPF